VKPYDASYCSLEVSAATLLETIAEYGCQPFYEDGSPTQNRELCLERAAQLRAQRQQGAEPVAWMHHFIYEDGEPEAVLSHSKEIPAILGGEYTGKTEALYTTPPQANALVAAAYRKAAEITKQVCLGRQTQDDAGSSRWLEAGKCARQAEQAVLSAIPADTEDALREVCMKVANDINGFMEDYAQLSEENLLERVNSVLEEGGK
jgi:hypothetical protein